MHPWELQKELQNVAVVDNILLYYQSYSHLYIVVWGCATGYG